MSVTSLEKVLRLAQGPQSVPEASDFVKLAGEDLERIALLLAAAADDDEDDDEPEDDDEGDGEDEGDEPPAGKKKLPLQFMKKGKKKAKGKGKKQMVEACQSAVLEAMVALHAMQGGELVSLTVLTQKQREKPSAHTIPGSTDYPIPDLAHLSAAVARYKEGKFAGHPQSVVKAHILKHSRRLGRQVDLAGDASSTVLALSQAMEKNTAAMGAGLVAMDHERFNGEHKHPHRKTVVVDEKHNHNHDCSHGVYPGSVY